MHGRVVQFNEGAHHCAQHQPNRHCPPTRRACRYAAHPGVIRDPKGPREDSGFKSEANPGTALTARLFNLARRHFPKTKVMAAGLRNKQGAPGVVSGMLISFRWLEGEGRGAAPRQKPWRSACAPSRLRRTCGGDVG